MSLFVIPRKVALRLKIFQNFYRMVGWLVGGRGGGDALDKKPHPVGLSHKNYSLVLTSICT